MTHYTNIKCEYQTVKIKQAFESYSKYITIGFKCSDLYGEDVVALTNSQLDRLAKAYEEKKGITITMSKTQLAHNIENRRMVFTGVSWTDSIHNNKLKMGCIYRKEVVCVG